MAERAGRGRFGSRHRRAAAALVVAVGFGAAGLDSAVAGPSLVASGLPSNCSASLSVVTCSYGFTGAEQAFAVPLGVSAVQVAATGAPGSSYSATGGVGGTASGSVSVTPGSSLYIEVGGPGQDFAAGGGGGWNGGGHGGRSQGSGGGGASDVRTISCAASCGTGGDSASLASRLLVAGGGGAGGADARDTIGGPGAGGAAGNPGDPGSADPFSDAGGGGGGAGGLSQVSNGGAGGTAATAGTDGDSGQPGALGQGGAGADIYSGGGGGGGGFYGGGGGGGGAINNASQDVAEGGGGGGGSSYAPGGVTGIAASTGIAPSVTVIYTATLSGAKAAASPSQSLTNGERVWVSGRRFPAGHTVSIVQCNQRATTQGLAACDTSHSREVTVTTYNQVPARAYRVATGTIGAGAGAGPCDSADPCLIVIYDHINSTIDAAALVSFAP